jgi:protein-S-isoprenylcysteine O-methyltransferase Ste14
MTDRNNPDRRRPPQLGRPTTGQPGWRWSNVPVPEAHVYLGVAALVMSVLYPRRISWRRSRHVGWPLVMAGSAIAAWATRVAGRTDLATPDRVVTGGPYAVSRHPMYVAWTAIYLGMAFVARTAWLLLLTPLLVVLVRREIEREEQRLTEIFGPAYVAYQARVRRYL